ncbi:sensor histidine kinase [Streptomyces europaeiscabiei]|uniref:sensor histidine kinase n=2 Tax=Streptomyces europaeiscabiei TaxID=146819 RepID=UPI0029AB28A6|nr:sensor histidine kinase [Streptomyces europaeiscabiei]MDX3580349.1 sensor histidine kinase [Streptomyces europaeiscabiei]
MRTRALPVARLGDMDPRIADALLAVGVTAASLIAGEQYHPAGWERFDALAYALSVLINLPLALRRRAPVPVLVVSCLAFAAYLMAGYQPSLNFWTPVIALYSVAAHRSPRTAAAAAALTAAVILYSGLTVPELGILLPVVQALAVPVVVWLVGNGTRRLAERNRQLAAVTEQLRREQEERARQAVTEERMRIARELHDVVAHHMAVIAQHADLANYVFSTEPLTARQALETIGASGREGLAEMRSMLDLLRVGPEGADDDSYTPAPGLDRLGELVQGITSADMPVRLRIEGAARRLPTGMGQSAYRIVQEALTNAAKHARPCRATVLVRYGGDSLLIQVCDNGQQPVPANSTGSTGYGLIGMRERARIFGGVLTTGPRPQGGFEVELNLPIPAGSTDSRLSRPD